MRPKQLKERVIVSAHKPDSFSREEGRRAVRKAVRGKIDTRTETCLVVEKKLYNRWLKVRKYDFINGQGTLRLLWGKKTKHIKLVVRKGWPRAGSMSDEFCTNLDARINLIEFQAVELNKALRGQL